MLYFVCTIYNNNFQNILGSSSWKCDAPLVPDVQFEKIDVQCDKVPDSPYDDLVVEGSCRLRYLKKINSILYTSNEQSKNKI